MTKEEKKNMSIANCRICLLSKSNCANCPLNWALPTILAEQVIEDMHNIEIPVEDFEITDELIENNPDEAMESLWLSTLED